MKLIERIFINYLIQYFFPKNILEIINLQSTFCSFQESLAKYFFKILFFLISIFIKYSFLSLYILLRLLILTIFKCLKNVLNCSLKAKQNLSFQILKLQQLHCDLKLCIESQKQEKSMTKKKNVR